MSPFCLTEVSEHITAHQSVQAGVLKHVIQCFPHQLRDIHLNVTHWASYTYNLNFEKFRKCLIEANILQFPE